MVFIRLKPHPALDRYHGQHLEPPPTWSFEPNWTNVGRTAKIWIHSKWSFGGFGRRLQLPNFVDLDQLVVHGILKEIFHKQNHQAFTYPNWALRNSMIPKIRSILLEAVPGHPGHPLFWIHTLHLRGKSTRGKETLGVGMPCCKIPWRWLLLGGWWKALLSFHRRQDQISHQPELMCVHRDGRQ